MLLKFLGCFLLLGVAALLSLLVFAGRLLASFGRFGRRPHAPNEPHEERRRSKRQAPPKNKQKIFAPDEGEYVDYEEVRPEK